MRAYLAVAVLALVALAPMQVEPMPGTISGCLPVSASFLRILAVPAAGAVSLTVDKSAAGLGRDGTVWFVSTPDDALWVTDADPTAVDPGGLILPLNDKARSKSDIGADVKPDAPVYRGFADYGSWVMAAEACAGVPE